MKEVSIKIAVAPPDPGVIGARVDSDLRQALLAALQALPEYPRYVRLLPLLSTAEADAATKCQTAEKAEAQRAAALEQIGQSDDDGKAPIGERLAALNRTAASTLDAAADALAVRDQLRKVVADLRAKLLSGMQPVADQALGRFYSAATQRAEQLEKRLAELPAAVTLAGELAAARALSASFHDRCASGAGCEKLVTKLLDEGGTK